MNRTTRPITPLNRNHLAAISAGGKKKFVCKTYEDKNGALVVECKEIKK